MKEGGGKIGNKSLLLGNIVLQSTKMPSPWGEGDAYATEEGHLHIRAFTD